MDLIAMPSILSAVLFTGSLYCIYRIYWELTTGIPRRRLRKAKGCAPIPKAPNYDPIFGLDRLWEVYGELKQYTALESVQRLIARLNAKTYQVNFLRDEIIVTIEPLNLKSVLSLDFKNWSVGEERKKSMAPFLGEGIFTTDGAAWQHSRNMLRPNFVRTQIEDLDMFEKHFNRLRQALPCDGSTVDLQDLFYSLTLDIATEFLFGESTNSLVPGGSSQKVADFTAAFTYCQNSLSGEGSTFGVLGAFLPDRRFNRCCKVVHAFVDSLIEKALANRLSQANMEKSSGSRYIFLDELLSQTTDKVRIRSELLNILLAGRDTTASLLSNVCFEVSRRPDVWNNLSKEVDAFSGAHPSYDQLKSMTYLRALLNESLRLYPIVPENARHAIADTVLPTGGGKDENSPVFIAKGQFVAWSLYAMHRRKDLYGEDAEDFRPERWLDHGDKKGLRVGWEYLPFNGGPRICIGQQFALMETSYIIVRLMQEFSAIESRDPEPWREKITLTCTGRGGCKVALTPKS